MKLLAIESSCDDAAVAVVEGSTLEQPVKVLAERTASQIDIHNKYGGVFPELAAREHFATLLPTIEETLKTLSEVEGLRQSPQDVLRGLDAIAVTAGPGLIGSLLVGVTVAQALAMGLGKKLIPVNHLAGHIYSTWLEDAEIVAPATILERKPDDPSGAQDRESMQPGSPMSVSASGSGSRMTKQVPKFPALALTVSGGHTHLVWMECPGQFEVLGRTRDDAAGEAFDKVSVMLGLGYPGGPAIQSAAVDWKSLPRRQAGETRNPKLETNSNIEIPKIPRPMIEEGLEFSFSGLKTAVRYWLDKHPDSPKEAMAYEVQEAITDVLVTKLLRAAEMKKPRSLILAGGVAANKRLREKLIERLALLFERSREPLLHRIPRLSRGSESKNSPTLHISSRAHSTDNGAMIGAAALAMLATGYQPIDPATVEARSSWPLSNW